MNDNPLEKAVGLNGKQIGGMLIRPPKTKVNSKHPSRLAAVYDVHHNPIRGLWFRLPHGPWVAQISHGGNSTKVKLVATTFPKAKEDHQRLKIQSKDGTLSAVGKSPNFTSYAQDYMNSITNEAKKCDSTIRAEKSRIVWWQNYLGTIPLNKISLATVRKGMAKLKTEGNRNRQLSDRSLNYYVTGINNVLNRAAEEGWLPSSPIPPKSLHKTSCPLKPPHPTPRHKRYGDVWFSSFGRCISFRNSWQLQEVFNPLFSSSYYVGRKKGDYSGLGE